jgi:hypothetical protein
MKNYALDSNIVSYYLKGHEKIIQKVRNTSIEKKPADNSAYGLF